MGDGLALLESFRSHLLRWNRQINLVTRQETADRLEGLLGQCIGGHQALEAWLAREGVRRQGRPLCYFDLGSGGGLPGIVWHRLWTAAGLSPCTWLVEPREKRAWFLERACAAEDGDGFGVLANRWGDAALEAGVWPPNPLVVVSLKALHLDDGEVLVGLGRTLPEGVGPADLVLARYYPPDQVLDEELMRRLDLELSGGVREVAGQMYSSLGVDQVPVVQDGQTVASLVLSVYRTSSSS